MSRQIDAHGAESERDPDSLDRVSLPDPPRRPLLVEFTTAVLVVGGVFGFLQKVANPLVPAPSALAFDPILMVALALDGLSIVAGVLMRSGRSWVVAANVAAVFAFLNLTLLNVQGTAFGALYLVVVAACFLSRDWFSAMADWRAAVVEVRLRR